MVFGIVFVAFLAITVTLIVVQMVRLSLGAKRLGRLMREDVFKGLVPVLWFSVYG